MKANAKNFFYFTRSERSGIAIFAVLCVFLFWLPTRFAHWKDPEKTDFSVFQQEIAGFKLRQTQSFAASPVADTIDPNVATEAELVAIGLPVRTARTILNYREKGGSFRYREDLKKIYTIDAESYEAIAPFIDLPSANEYPRERPVLVKNGSEAQPRPFDPNTVTKEDLLRLGLSDRVARTLINYRSSGGVFRHPEDLRKVYGISEAQYERLAPFIRLSDAIEPAVSEFRSNNGPAVLDVNQSDASDWQKLPGIGPVLSARIVKFRDKLGGFVSVAQVAETYGLQDSTFQRIADRLIVSPILSLLAVNRASAEELSAHPYLNGRQAKAIVHYRIHHGPLRDLSDFAKIEALTDEERKRVEPYLSFD